MKFKTGDKIKMKMFYPFSLHNHRDAIGEVIGTRTKKRWGGKYELTHYYIKWDCYKIPHIYTIREVDEYCELITT